MIIVVITIYFNSCLCITTFLIYDYTRWESREAVIRSKVYYSFSISIKIVIIVTTTIIWLFVCWYWKYYCLREFLVWTKIVDRDFFILCRKSLILICKPGGCICRSLKAAVQDHCLSLFFSVSLYRRK